MSQKVCNSLCNPTQWNYFITCCLWYTQLYCLLMCKVHHGLINRQQQQGCGSIPCVVSCISKADLWPCRTGKLCIFWCFAYFEQLLFLWVILSFFHTNRLMGDTDLRKIWYNYVAWGFHFNLLQTCAAYFFLICDHPPRNQCKRHPWVIFSSNVISRRYMS